MKQPTRLPGAPSINDTGSPLNHKYELRADDRAVSAAGPAAAFRATAC